MKWERRKITNEPLLIPQELPIDYIKLVIETLDTALAKGVAEIKKTHPKVAFTAGGAVFSDEIFLAITLSQGDQNLSATTVYASADFNPALEKPSVQDVLAACLDAAGSVFNFYLNPKNPEKAAQILDSSLSALEEAPFDWTPVEIDEEGATLPVFVKMDKANPILDALADEWLKKHDPDFDEQKEAEEFLERRLEAIKAAKTGSTSGPGSTGFGSSDSGPIRH